MDGERKGRPFTRLAGDADIAAHIARQAARYGEANPGAGGWFAAVAVFDLVIHGEYFVLFRFRDTNPGVFHFEVQDIAFVIAHADVHPTALWGKFHGVADKIPQDLPQAGAVGDHLVRQRQARLQHKAQSLLLRLQTRKVFKVGKEAGEVHRLVIELYLTALHFIHVDNIIEDIPQRHRRDMDGFQVFFLLAGQFGIQQNSAQPDDPVQRGTQLMADGGDEGGFIPAGAFECVLIAFSFGDIAPEAHQAATLTDAIVVRDLADFEARFTAIGIVQPLLIGQRYIVAEHLLIGFQHLFRCFFAIDVLWFEVDQLFLAFAGQQLHRPVTAGKLFILIAVKDQVRGGVEERAQKGGLLFELDLRLFTLFHLDLQLLKGSLTLGFRLFTFANLLIQLRDIVFQLHIQLQIALAHLLQLLHQPRQTLAGLFELLHHHREKVDRPRGDQQTEEDRADNVDAFNLAMQHHGDRHLYHDGQHHQRKSQQH